MANIVWNGSTGQLTTAGNWVGGAAPAGSDVAVFNRGSQDVDPALGNIAALQGIEIYPDYGGAIGGSGNIMTTSVDTIMHLGRAAFWFADSAGLTDDVYVRTASRDTVVHLGGDTMTRVTVLRGTVTIDGTAGTIANLHVGHVDNMESDVALAITSGAVVATLRQWGGVITCPITITNAYVANGVLKLTLTTTGTITNLYQSGGRVKHDTTTTVALAYVGPGTLDLGQAAKTITKLVRLPGANILRSPTIHTVTTEHYLDKVA